MAYATSRLDRLSRPARQVAVTAWVAVRSAWRWLQKRLGVNALIAVFALTLIVIIFGSVIVQSQLERQKTIDNAVRQNSNLALAFVEHALRTFKAVDAVTLFLKRDFERHGMRVNILDYLDDNVVDGKLATRINVFDERGDLIASTHAGEQINVSNREPFRAHAKADSGQLFISQPLVGQRSGKWSVFMTRRINKPDGSFGGTVSMAVDPRYFTSFYAQTELGAQGYVNLVGFDGISLARQEGKTSSFGQDVLNTGLFTELAHGLVGSFLARETSEGVRRYTSFHTVPGYPLIVAVGTAQDEVLAEFTQKYASDLRWALLFSSIILGFSALLMRALGRQKRADAALAGSNAQFRATFDNAAVGIVHTTPDGRYLRVNRKFCELVGYSREELLSMCTRDLNHPDELDAHGVQAARLVAGEIPDYRTEKRFVRKDGSMIWTRRSVSLVRDDEGRPQYLIRVVEDITERRQTEAALRASEETLRATFSQAGVGITMTSPGQRYLQVNDKYCDMLGYTRDELMSLSTAQVMCSADAGSSLENRQKLIHGEVQNTSVERQLVRKDGSLLWVHHSTSLARDEKGQPRHFITVAEDISERKRAQEQLMHLAHHDSLTSLPNRELFYDRLGHALDRARRRNSIVAVLFIDLDRFKVVNDTLGHDVGDQLLRQVAPRLLQCVRAEDTVGRLGGDEFAIILTELARTEDARIVAQKIIDTLAAPFEVGAHEVFTEASIGVATYPCDADTGANLIKNADVAMYRAKAQGRNNYQFYSAAMNTQTTERLQLENQLRYAVQREEFVLHFQPKANLATGQITGVEALLRWRRNGGELVSPAEFIPLLEESGLIVSAGEWVLRAACAQIRAWQACGLAPVPVAVNLSARQFHQQNICEIVMNALREYGVPPHLLELEITESAAMLDAQATTTTLCSLKALGVRIAIDDFGTGYSSLGYLKRYPIDSLKIDRSFVTDLPGDQDDASIAQAVITLAHALRLKVIAEGVENEAQLEFLAANGCDEMQGYYFSRPLTAEACTQFLKECRKLEWSPADRPRRNPRALAAVG